jgi:uncharacterized membrane protein
VAYSLFVGAHLLSILVAFAGYSLLDLSKVFQKMSLGILQRKKLAGTIIWLAATLATSVSSFVILYAVGLGSVVIVGAMAGTGLAVVVLVSIFILKEQPNLRELLGVAAVLVGPFVIGSFAPEPAPTHVLIIHLFVFMVAVFGLYLLSVLVVTARPGLRGVVLSGFAGAIGGFVILFQKVSTTAFARNSSFLGKLDPHSPLARFAAGSTGELLVQVFTNPYSLTWILLSLLSMFILQLSYRYDKAIRLIPAFAANSILMPIVGGVLVFQERLHPMNWVGVSIILLGVGLLLPRSGERRRSEQAGSQRLAGTPADQPPPPIAARMK